MKHLKNFALSLTTVLLLYIVVEASVLRLFFTWLPPIANPLLDDGIPVILQSSKASVNPQNYIALTGDSYAMGLGDQFYPAASKAKAEYGSAPFIQAKTGKDVISFGSAGNGSVAGMVTEPLSTLAYWKASARIAAKDPDILLVYFYEGNDLNDNVEYLQQASKKRLAFDYTRLHDSDYFQPYIQEVALNQDSLYQQAKKLHWYDELYLGKFVLRSSAALISQWVSQITSPADKKSGLVSSQSPRSPLNPPGRFEWTEPGTTNQALIHGENVTLPDQLQGPSMDLTEEEKEIALISFRESLHFLKQRLPNTKIVIVYVPSVISSYQITSQQVSVQSHARRKRFIFDTPAVQQQSDWMAQNIQRISIEEKTAFVDARSALRKAVGAIHESPLLHGPLDWNHFNEAGYQALAEAAMTGL